MKASNKYSIITGAVLLALAALFSISMILLPLDFGAAGPGHNNILFLLGDMLYSVYGFSSILIPAFLLIASLSCFASEWTARKTMRFLTALVPFFTCVITENICRSIINLDNTSFPEVKIAVTIVTGVMLVVIEYFAAGILADKIAKKVRYIGGGLRYVKAMGVELIERNIVQVSMNMTDYTKTSLYQAYEMVKMEALRYGVPVVGTEVIGLAPMASLLDVASYYLQIENFDYRQIIESRLLE